MAIGFLTAGVNASDNSASTGQDVADTVNSLLGSRVQHRQSVILFGDSYAETENYPPLGNTTSFSMYRFILGALGNSVKVVKNSGVSGNTVPQMLARIQSDVIDYSSDWVFINGGVNDFYNSASTADSVFSTMSEIVDLILASNRRVLLFNCVPQVSSRANFSSAKSAENAKYNNLLAAYAKTKSNVVLVDLYSDLVNWGDTTNAGGIADYFASDGIHLSTLGEIVVANAAIKKLAGIFTPDLSIINPPLDAGLAGSEGLFIGTGGSNGGSSSGPVATSYTSSRVSGTNGTIVNSKLPLRGQRQTITLTSTNGEMKTRLFGNLLAELSPYAGQVVTTSILMRLRTTSGGASLKDALVKLYTAVSSTITQAVNGGPLGGYAPITDTQFDTGVVLLTLRDLTIPVGVDSAGMYFELLLDSVAGGVVEFDIYSVNIRVVA